MFGKLINLYHFCAKCWWTVELFGKFSANKGEEEWREGGKKEENCFTTITLLTRMIIKISEKLLFSPFRGKLLLRNGRPLSSNGFHKLLFTSFELITALDPAIVWAPMGFNIAIMDPLYNVRSIFVCLPQISYIFKLLLADTLINWIKIQLLRLFLGPLCCSKLPTFHA